MAIKQNTLWQGLFVLVSLLSVISFVSAAQDCTPKTATQNKTLPRLAGCINLAGWDFGAQNTGTYAPGDPSVAPPKSQIPHFLKQNVNLFRVPVAWQFLQPEMNQPLNATNLKTYTDFVKSITSQRAYAIIDLHSYARYKGQIVGESSSTPAAALADFWLRLSANFKDDQHVMLGISNEPHDQDIEKWSKTVQEVVTKLRTNKVNNILLLPGTDWTSLKAFPEWYQKMKTVKNPDGSFEGLIFEVHRYLDSDNSGTSVECVASHVDEVLNVTKMLKADGRQVLVGETGGGSTASCTKYLPQFVKAITDSYPTFTGFAVWAAGSFGPTYELVTTVEDKASPTGWKDRPNWLSIKQFLPTGATNKA